MSNVYRYINNTAKDIISGAYLVPAYDQLIYNEPQPVLDALVGKTLVGIVNGVVTEVQVKAEKVPTPAPAPVTAPKP
jgi:hypothetical protein